MRQRRGRILLLGYYGAANLGDDLMVKGIIDELLATDLNVRITIIAYHRNALPISASERVNVLRTGSFLSKIMTLMPLFLQSKLALFGGGTAFTDKEGDGSYKFFRLASILGCKFGYLGVGIDEVTDESRIQRAKWLLRHAALVSLRDSESYSRAIKITGGELPTFVKSDDPCYLFLKRNPIARKEPAPAGEGLRILVSWRELTNLIGTDANSELADRLAGSINHFSQGKSIKRITLLPLDPDIDLEIHEYLAEALSEYFGTSRVELVMDKVLESRINVIRSTDIYFSARLHGAFLGKLLGVPTVGFSYSAKVDSFFMSIGSNSYLALRDLYEDETALGIKAEIAIVEASRLRIDLEEHYLAAREGIRSAIGSCA
jgi:polysaccharide pyruvyl transferase WcaK-like protein